jgi:hypothetical protein
MASIPGSVTITGFVAPTDTADTYATHDSIYGKGGHREVADTTARNAIPAARRREGMTVYCNADAKNYQLVGGILDTNWTSLDRYDHTQVVLTNTWVITHNMNKYPNVIVIDSVQQQTIGDITYNSANQLTIVFSASITGMAYLS